MPLGGHLLTEDVLCLLPYVLPYATTREDHVHTTQRRIYLPPGAVLVDLGKPAEDEVILVPAEEHDVLIPFDPTPTEGIEIFAEAGYDIPPLPLLFIRRALRLCEAGRSRPVACAGA